MRGHEPFARESAPRSPRSSVRAGACPSSAPEHDGSRPASERFAPDSTGDDIRCRSSPPFPPLSHSSPRRTEIEREVDLRASTEKRDQENRGWVYRSIFRATRVEPVLHLDRCGLTVEVTVHYEVPPLARSGCGDGSLKTTKATFRSPSPDRAITPRCLAGALPSEGAQEVKRERNGHNQRPTSFSRLGIEPLKIPEAPTSGK